MQFAFYIAPGLLVLGWLWLFYGMYTLVMGVYRAHLEKRLRWWNYYTLGPFVVLGWLMDVVTNVTLAWVVFLDPPRELLVTQRLQRYIAGKDSWQRRLAGLICESLLDPLDPTGEHC